MNAQRTEVSQVDVASRWVEGELTLVVRFERPNKKGRTRFYVLHIERERQLPLDGREAGFALVVNRGIIDGITSSRRESFSSLARALERWGALCARRRQHGYLQRDAAWSL